MRERLTVVGIFAGIAAIGVLVVVVLGPGRWNPSPPALAGNPVPALPGEVLYIDDDDCIIRARLATAEREEVVCGGPDLQDVSWLEDGRIGYASFGPGGPAWTELDPATGRTAVTSRFPQRNPPDAMSVKGERVDFDRDGSVYVVAGTVRRRVLAYDGPERRRPFLVTWSPDGEWLLLRSKDELWLVARDGSVSRTLGRTREYSQGGSWRIDRLGYLPPVTLMDTRR